MLKKRADKRQIAGWTAVGLATLITCFWAFWGIVENFHEGWYYEALLSNMGLMLVQYLSPMLVFLGVTLLAIFWPRLGGGLHILLALAAVGFFQAFSNAAALLIILPLIGLGVLYWFGRPYPRWAAVLTAVGLPLLTLIMAGAGPALRVAQRVDDGDRGARLVEGNGVALIWAPAGPGWPDKGMSWDEAQEVCLHLDEAGLVSTADAQQIWRLPTVDEAVRSMARHGRNSGGVWDPERAEAAYKTKPDKESPLWDTHSQVIYWWTASEVDEERAYIIVYDGRVWPRAKELRQGYLGFRCAKPGRD